MGAADLESRLLGLLQHEPLSRAELARALGQRTISGQLKVVLRSLMLRNVIGYTLPDKPNSRLQKYRLVDRDEA